MWIKAFLPLGVLALAAVPRLVPAAPAPVAPPAKAAPASFTTICHDGELAVSRPDPAWVATGFGNDGCRLAPVPAAFDGASVARDRIVAAMADARRYEAAADAFRQCVAGFVAAHASLTPAQRLIEAHRLVAAQKSREAAAAQSRAEIEAFNMYGIECSG